MSVVDTLTQKIGQLPVSRQLEVLDFVEFLEQKQQQAGPRRDPAGSLADRPSNLSLEDFKRARQEAWAKFPREMPR